MMSELTIDILIDGFFMFIFKKIINSSVIKIDFVPIFYTVNDANQLFESRLMPIVLNGKLYMQLNIRDLSDFQQIILHD